MSCQGKMCAPGAVGCLLHAVHGEEYDDYEGKHIKNLIEF